MTVSEREITVVARRSAVWSCIADLGAVASWNPGVVRASCDAERSGTGVTRRCELRPGGVITEVVTRWVPDQELWLAVGSHGAIRSADFGLVLSDVPIPIQRASERRIDWGTSVRAIADWHLHYGPLGAVIDHVTVRRLMSRVLETTLTGLKSHMESSTKPAFAAEPDLATGSLS